MTTNPMRTPAGNVVTMASPSPTDTATKMTDGKKQERMELLTYVKAHLDLVAVTLLVAYLGYSVYKMNKGQK